MSQLNPFTRVKGVVGSFIDRITGKESARLRRQIRQLRRNQGRAASAPGKSEYSELTPEMDADAIGGSVNVVTRAAPAGFRQEHDE